MSIIICQALVLATGDTKGSTGDTKTKMRAWLPGNLLSSGNS